MKIAFVSTILRYPWGGADTLWTHAAEAAISRGDQLLLCISKEVACHPRVAALIAAGASIAPWGRAAPRWRRRVGRLLGRKMETDAVVAAMAKFKPCKVIFSLGGTYDLVYMRAVPEWLVQTATEYHVIANWQQEDPDLTTEEHALAVTQFSAARSISFVSARNLVATRRHLLNPLANARVLQNPLRWQPNDRTPWPESAPRLACVARLETVKGVHLLLHALREVAADFPNWHLDVFGQGPQERYLRDVVAYLSLGERVEFRGYVPSLKQIWKECQLLCSPAINEGVPMTIPEAMLCGRPVLATCVGGAEDWIDPGRTGFLSAASTVPLIAAELRTALAKHAQWREMGAAAAITAAERYRAKDYLTLLA